jgi:hypothetical protein
MFDSGQKFAAIQMKDIIVAIIGGLFTLAAVWLSDYLKKRGENPPRRTRTQTIKGRPETPSPSPVSLQPSPEVTRQPEKVSIASRWTVFSGVVVVGVSIGGAFFADWLLYWSASVFDIQLRVPGAAWLVLLLAGAIWGSAYFILGLGLASHWPELLLAPLVGWFDFFDFVDFGDCIRGLLTALPLNVLIPWGLAHGAATLASRKINAHYDGVVYLVFSIMTVIEIGAAVANA